MFVVLLEIFGFVGLLIMKFFIFFLGFDCNLDMLLGDVFFKVYKLEEFCCSLA